MTEAADVSGPRLAHVVRDFGGLTEPFIWQRVAFAGRFDVELWHERAARTPPVAARRVRLRLLAPGTAVERLYHRMPLFAPLLAGPYRGAERTFRPDLIHAHYASTGYLVGSVTRAPLVVSAYGFDVSVLPRRWGWRRAFRALASRAAALLVEGPRMGETLVGLGIPSDRVRLVPIAAGLDGVTFRGPRTRPPGPVCLLMCGRLVEKKGHGVGIHAFARLRHELPPGSRLEIVGSGPEEERLRSLARSLGVTDMVRFTGTLEREAFHARLAEADLFLAPSMTARNGDREGGAPTTILDAHAVGTVVVASRHADIPTLVQEGATGHLAAEGDEADLAAAVRRALADRSRWPAVAQAARAALVRLHSDEAVEDRLRAIYDEVLAEPGASAVRSGRA